MFIFVIAVLVITCITTFVVWGATSFDSKSRLLSTCISTFIAIIGMSFIGSLYGYDDWAIEGTYILPIITITLYSIGTVLLQFGHPCLVFLVLAAEASFVSLKWKPELTFLIVLCFFICNYSKLKDSSLKIHRAVQNAVMVLSFGFWVINLFCSIPLITYIIIGVMAMGVAIKMDFTKFKKFIKKFFKEVNNEVSEKNIIYIREDV